MAISTGTFEMHEARRQEYADRVAEYSALVQKIIDNRADAPTAKTGVWADEMFREIVVRTLRKMAPLQEQAEHLRIIKSVFGGKS